MHDQHIPLLAARGLGRRYGSTVALDGVDFRLGRNRVVGIVGESGSGKSTLSRILIGLEAADEGVVVLDGREVGVRRSRSDRRRVQMVFQDPRSSLNPRLSIRESIEDFLTVHGMARGKERRERALEGLQRVGLDVTAAGRRPSELSGGQLQRACIARALIIDPEVLIADEPTSALDVSIQGQILNLLDGLRESLSIVLVTHDIGVVSFMADDVMVMNRGRVVEAGPANQVIVTPEDPYTRRLLSANQPGAAPIF